MGDFGAPRQGRTFPGRAERGWRWLMGHLAHVAGLYRQGSSFQEYCDQIRRGLQRLPARTLGHDVRPGGRNVEGGTGPAGWESSAGSSGYGPEVALGAKTDLCVRIALIDSSISDTAML